MDIHYVRSCVAVLQPAPFNSPPQVVIESELISIIRFVRSDPLRNRMDGHDIRWDPKVRVVPAQYLSYHQLTVHNNESTHAGTYFVDDHPEGIAIGLPGRSINF